MNENMPNMEELSQISLSKQLMEARIISVFGEINQKVSRAVTERLLVLDNKSDDEIKIIINSQGGHVESADTIFDMINFVKAPVKVIGTGWVASAGALIYAAPPIGKRFCLPNTRFLLHQPSGGVGGAAVDIDIEAREMIKMRQRLNKILAEQTKQTIEKVEKDTNRNFWMNAEEAKKYGLVGKIIKSIKDA